MLKKKNVVFAFATLLVASLVLPTKGTMAQNKPLTVAEKSDFKSTSLSAEVIEFIDQCVAQGNHIAKKTIGKTIENREIVAVAASKKPYKFGQQDERCVVLLLGNIHSGECAGKEALLMQLRELAFNPDHKWLDNLVIIFVPNYSADANDRVGLRNRPGQIGPENGMGRRQNAQGLDLNRDFVKAEAAESHALIGLINQTTPHLFVDCHTTNGSKHQYGLTYDVPHNPACPEEIRSFLRQKMMPEISKRMEAKKWFTFYYGNFNRDHTKWTTFGYEPRYSTEYVGLRGRLSILSEAYSYISYKDRIQVTKDFVADILDYTSENCQEIQKLLKQSEENLIRAAKERPQRVSVSLAAKVTSFREKYKLKGFKDDKPHDYECEFVGNYQSTRSTPLPYAYLLPANYSRIYDRLRMHGIEVYRLENDTELEIEFDTVKEFNRAERAFQKHKMVRVECDRQKATRTIAKGTYVIPTSQRLALLIAYMLESNSDDGLIFWNFFDKDLAVGKTYPVLRVPAPVEMELSKFDGPAGRNLQITLDMIDGPNALLQDTDGPKWFGKTQKFETTVYGRKLLVDAESVSFAERVAPPLTANDLIGTLTSEGFEPDVANKVANSDANMAENQLHAIYSGGDHAIVVRIEDKKIVQLGNPDSIATNIHFNHNQTRVAFTNEEGMHFVDLNPDQFGEKTSLVGENAKKFVGRLDWVYQEELYGRGNFKGYWWNPINNQVAFLELDESPVLSYPVFDHIPVRGKTETTNYPKAGDPLPTVRLGVINVDGKKDNVSWVDLGDYKDIEFLISQVSWTSDGKQLLVQLQDREQTWLDLLAVSNPESKPTRYFRDETQAWIESPGEPTFLQDGSFLWLSPRNGYKHLYRYGADGKMLGQITQGEWEIRKLYGISPDSKFAYFAAAKENAGDVQCYRVELESGEVLCLTPTPGTHTVSFDHNFNYFFDSHSTATEPERYYLYRSDGTFLRELNSTTDDRMKYLQVKAPEFIEVPSANDQPMDAKVIKPADFDANKKYPVLVHIYGGPQAPRARNQYRGKWYLWHQMLAQQGYVVFVLDNQSCSYRSAKNVWPIHKNFGVNELRDLELGVDWLKKQSWVDSERIGLWGWSYGGYMTAYAMTRSQSFKMGISGAPVTDWRNYDAIYTERYMGTPQNNPEGYETTSVLPHAKDLHGNLLLVHGTIDDNVHVSNTLQLVHELQKHGKQFELMLYPKNRHSVRDPDQLAHLRKLMTNFVLENL